MEQTAKETPPVILPEIVDNVPIITEKSKSISPINISADVSMRKLPQILMLTNIAQYPVALSTPVIFDTVHKSIGNAITAIIRPTYTAIRLLPGYVYKCTANIPWATCDMLYTWYADKPFGTTGVTVSSTTGDSVGYIQNNTAAPIYIFLVFIRSRTILFDMWAVKQNPAQSLTVYKMGNPEQLYNPWALIEAIQIL